MLNADFGFGTPSYTIPRDQPFFMCGKALNQDQAKAEETHIGSRGQSKLERRDDSNLIAFKKEKNSNLFN